MAYENKKQFEFGRAAADGDLVTIKRLLSDPEVDPSANFDEPLRWACTYGHVKIVKCLLVDPRVTVQTFNTLYQAVQYGHVNVVSALLADPRLDPACDNNTLIRRAISNEQTQVARRLLADPRVDPSDWDNQCIQDAAKLGNARLFRMLLADSRVDPSNESVLMAAVHGRHPKIVQALLEDPRVDPTGGGWNTPLNVAADNNDICIVSMLSSHLRITSSYLTLTAQALIVPSLAEAAWFRRRYIVMYRAMVWGDY